MAEDLIRLIWQRQAAGYDLRQYEPLPSKARFPSTIVTGELLAGTYLWPRDGEAEEYEVEWADFAMLMEFLSIERDADNALRFVTKWGSPIKGTMMVSEFLNLQRRFVLDALRGSHEGVAGFLKLSRRNHFGSLTVGLTARSTGAVRMALNAETPLQFMKLQLLGDVSTGMRIYRCEGCGDFAVATSLGNRPRTCSSRCRQRLSRKKRR